MAALNLVDMAKGMKDDVMAGILFQNADHPAGLLMQRLPYRDVTSRSVVQWQIDSVTPASTRRIGQGFGTVKDSFSPSNEGTYIYGDQLDIDRAHFRGRGDADLDPWAENLALEAERFRYRWNDDFINGNRGTNPDAINGLKKRLDDLVAGGFSETKIAASSATSGLELGTSDANRHAFLDKFEESKFELRGMVDLVLTSQAGYLAMGRVARRSGLLDITKDVFDREVTNYAGIPVGWAGTKGDQTTEIILSTEDPGDGGNDATSFYFVRFGPRYVHGIQLMAPEKSFDDILNDGVTHRVVWEWEVGLTSFDKRSFARLHKVVPNFA